MLPAGSSSAVACFENINVPCMSYMFSQMASYPLWAISEAAYTIIAMNVSTANIRVQYMRAFQLNKTAAWPLPTADSVCQPIVDGTAAFPAPITAPTPGFSFKHEAINYSLNVQRPIRSSNSTDSNCGTPAANRCSAISDRPVAVGFSKLLVHSRVQLRPDRRPTSQTSQLLKQYNLDILRGI